jgi:hypothetical protein
MDWIERVLPVSPDGGSGATELVYLEVGGFVVVAVLAARLVGRSRRQSRSAGSDER